MGRTTIRSLEHAAQIRNPMKVAEYQESKRGFSPNTIVLEGSKFFYLPPLPYNKEFVPILIAKCDVSRSSALFRIELHSYSQNDGRPYSFGFRFESPGDSPHDYWHTQIIDQTIAGIVDLPGCPKWLPATVPCIPLSATDVVTLLFTILVSLYGLEFVREILDDMSAAREFRARLGNLLQK